MRQRKSQESEFQQRRRDIKHSMGGCPKKALAIPAAMRQGAELVVVFGCGFAFRDDDTMARRWKQAEVMMEKKR